MITYSEYKNNKSQKKYENYKMISTKIKSFDKIVVIATSSSVKLSPTGIRLMAILISKGIPCRITNRNRVK